MLKKINKILIAGLIIAVMGLGLTVTAQAASSYAVSYDNIWQFNILGDPVNFVPLEPNRYTSRASADLGPFGNPAIISDIDTRDAPPTTPGSRCFEAKSGRCDRRI
jgi:hypothetical protein